LRDEQQRFVCKSMTNEFGVNLIDGERFDVVKGFLAEQHDELIVAMSAVLLIKADLFTFVELELN